MGCAASAFANPNNNPPVVTLGGGLHLSKRRQRWSMAMPSARKYMSGRFLTLEDLLGQPPLKEKIADVAPVDGKYGERLVATFESGSKLSLNKTSVGNLCRDYGDDYALWLRHDVKVWAGEVDFSNGKTDAILVEGADVEQSADNKKKTGSTDMDDEIPF
jgi:hypothetical protein